MKLILTILFLFALSTQAQYKAININKTILRYDTTLVNEVPESMNTYSWMMLRLKSNDDTLAVIFNDGTVWTKAAVVSGSIAQIGTTSIIQITLPSTIGANKYLLQNQVVYQYNGSHRIPDLFTDKKTKAVIRNSDNKEVATYHGNGFIWHEMPSTTALLTQGIVRVVFP